MLTRRVRPLAVAVVFALVLALGALPALAAGPAGLDLAKKGGNGHGKAKGGAPWFSDVNGSFWAWQDIETMAAKGIMQGYGKGAFGPKNHVTRLELVVLATRLMGFEDEALAMDPAEVADLLGDTFVDYRAIPAWPGARACVAYALKQGYLWPLMQSGGGPTFRPNSPAKRVEVIVVLFEAAGLGTEADARIDADLAFRDASAVPAWAWGYVALAVELGILRGSGGNLSPNQPVSRAEVAALMNRLDDYIETDLDRDIITGSVVEVNISTDAAVPSTITVTPDTAGGLPGTGQKTYPLVPAVVVMLDDQPASLISVTAGLHVALYLNDEGKVLLISGDTEVAPPATEVTGLIVATTLTSDGRLASVTLWHDDKAEVFTAGATVVVTRAGQEAALSELVPGLTVELTLTEGEVTAIELAPGTPVTTTVEGTVTRVVLGSGAETDPSISVIPESGTVPDEETYIVATGVEITVNGAAAALGDVRPGDAVVLTVNANDEVTKIVATYAVSQVTATVVGTVLDAGGKLMTLTVRSGDQDTTYAVDPAATVSYNGAEVTGADVATGDTVTLAVARGLVTGVTIVAKAPAGE